MKKSRFTWMAIATITTLILILIGQPSKVIKSSFAVVNIGLPTQAQQASPTPKPSPSPAASPTPSPTPTPTPTPTPILTPPTPEVQPLPLSESNYKDPQGRFQIESPEGNLAYTVVAKTRESNRQIPNASLAQIAIETFERGEGFQPDSYQELGTGSVRLPWTATLKMGAKTQPIQGTILGRQSGNNIFLLLVSATEEKTTEIDAAIAALSDTLKPIEPSQNQP